MSLMGAGLCQTSIFGIDSHHKRQHSTRCRCISEIRVVLDARWPRSMGSKFDTNSACFISLHRYGRIHLSQAFRQCFVGSNCQNRLRDAIEDIRHIEYTQTFTIMGPYMRNLETKIIS